MGIEIHRPVSRWKRHWLIGLLTLVATALAVVAINAVVPKVYTVSTSLLVMQSDPASTQPVSSSTVESHIEILKSDLVLSKALHRLGFDEGTSTSFDVNDLRGALEFSKNSSSTSTTPTQIIHIHYPSQYPAFAQKTLKQLTLAYQQALDEIAQNVHHKQVKDLQDKLAKVRAKRNIILHQLNQLLAKTGTPDIRLKSAELVKANSVILHKLGDINAEMVAVNAQLNNSRRFLKLSPAQVRQLSAIQRDPIIAGLQKNLVTETNTLVEYLAKYTQKHPKVIDKEQVVAGLKDAMTTRVRRVYGQQVSPEFSQLSAMDQDLVRQLMNQTIQLEGLRQQKAYFTQHIQHLAQDLANITQSQKNVAEIEFQQEILAAEERKLLEKIQDITMLGHGEANLGTFTILNPSMIPHHEDYTFPLDPFHALFIGLGLGVLLSLTTTALAENINPHVTPRDMPGKLLGQLTGQTSADEKTTAAMFEKLCMLMRQNNLKTLTFTHFAGQKKGDAKGGAPASKTWDTFNQCFHQLGTLFAKRRYPTLVVDFNESPFSGADNALDDSRVQKVFDTPASSLYKSIQHNDLHFLIPRPDYQGQFNPMMVAELPNAKDFAVVLLAHSVTVDHQTDLSSLQIGADGIVAGISKSSTPASTVVALNKANATDLNTVGTILLP